MGLQLVIGNNNYSSWSFRPWLAMKGARIEFEETVIPLDAPDFKSRLTALSGAGKVPVLIEGDTRVWESLAILEYLAEKFPEASLWPRDAQVRAHARAIAAEMHAGFQPLRRELPMNMRRPVKPHALVADAAADVARIEAIWSDCRKRLGQAARFSMVHSALYGAFGAADAMYAPVVSRFPTYGGGGRRRRARIHARDHGLACLERMARGGAARAGGPPPR